MITTDNTYTIDVPQIFNKAAKEMTDRQRRVANQPSVRKSGYLADHLQENYHIGSYNGSTNLMFIYPLYTRYIDMLFRGKGASKKQKKKVNIYNRLVWGFLMGYIYRRHKAGLAAFMSEKLRETKIEI